MSDPAKPIRKTWRKHFVPLSYVIQTGALVAQNLPSNISGTTSQSTPFAQWSSLSRSIKYPKKVLHAYVATCGVEIRLHRAFAMHPCFADQKALPS
jgi:hypothetical protein